MSTGHDHDHPPGVVSLLDGDAGVREAMGRMLQPAGWELRCYGSPSEYMAAPRPSLPACVVLEALLPGDSGLELQRRLQEAGDPTPLVFVTAQGDLATGVRAMKAGAVDYLAKPVSAPCGWRCSATPSSCASTSGLASCGAGSHRCRRASAR